MIGRVLVADIVDDVFLGLNVMDKLEFPLSLEREGVCIGNEN